VPYVEYNVTWDAPGSCQPSYEAAHKPKGKFTGGREALSRCSATVGTSPAKVDSGGPTDRARVEAASSSQFTFASTGFGDDNDGSGCVLLRSLKERGTVAVPLMIGLLLGCLALSWLLLVAVVWIVGRILATPRVVLTGVVAGLVVGSLALAVVLAVSFSTTQDTYVHGGGMGRPEIMYPLVALSFPTSMLGLLVKQALGYEPPYLRSAALMFLVHWTVLGCLAGLFVSRVAGRKK
jgi:hypothetical protein